MREIKWTTTDKIIAKYEALLFDAYGVLINHDGALAGAPELISSLNRQNKSYFVVTNDASRSPEEASAWYQTCDLDISAHRVISSGSLLKPYFDQQNLQGAKTLVLGPEGSMEMARRAGAALIDWSADGDFDVLAICDESGFPFPEALDGVISNLFRMWDKGKEPALLLLNPDCIYPQGVNRFGIAAGSIAALMRAAVSARYPERSESLFLPMGKPHKPIFEEAAKRAQTRSLVMIGDQVATDIRGAHTFGIDSVLMVTGVERLEKKQEEWKPTYHMRHLLPAPGTY